jgi:predicted TIM-barrel fold metal-dependent hydrolase
MDLRIISVSCAVVSSARQASLLRPSTTLEHALAAHELASLDRTVISNAVHYLRFCKTTKEVVAALESSNRYLAKCRDQHPEKFVAMATCVPGGGDEPLKELERAGSRTTLAP